MKSSPFTVIGLRDVYHEVGDFEFKVVLDRRFKGCRGSSVVLRDSDQRERPVSSREWGQKFICSFSVTPDFPDGVAVFDLVLKDGETGESHRERLRCWIIK